MSQKSRLKEFIEFKGLSVSAFERECGLGNGFVSKIGDFIRKEKLELISNRFPELNIDWVINEKGSMIAENTMNSIVCEPSDEYIGAYRESAKEKANDSDYVPLLPVEAMAGSLQGMSEGVALKDCHKIKSPVKGADWAIQISGDSMEPYFHNGTYLYIRKLSGAFMPWGQTLVVDTIDGVVVKDIFPVENTEDYIEARSKNTKYPPFKIETSCILGVYRVLGGSFVNSTI